MRFLNMMSTINVTKLQKKIDLKYNCNITKILLLLLHVILLSEVERLIDYIMKYI